MGKGPDRETKPNERNKKAYTDTNIDTDTDNDTDTDTNTDNDMDTDRARHESCVQNVPE